jgi:hypothetical protein
MGASCSDIRRSRLRALRPLISAATPMEARHSRRVFALGGSATFCHEPFLVRIARRKAEQ